MTKTMTFLLMPMELQKHQHLPMKNLGVVVEDLEEQSLLEGVRLIPENLPQQLENQPNQLENQLLWLLVEVETYVDLSKSKGEVVLPSSQFLFHTGDLPVTVLPLTM